MAPAGPSPSIPVDGGCTDDPSYIRQATVGTDERKDGSMHKGFGIAALIVAVIGIGIPLITIYMVWLALALAALSAFLGNKAFPLAATLVCLINALFLSPSVWILLTVEPKMFYKATTIVLFIAPIAGLIIGRPKKPAVEAS